MHSAVRHIALMETMADRLKQARELRYDTATEAAEALGVTESTYLGHENGSRGFLKHAARYANFYQVRIQWLLTGLGPMEGPPVERLFNSLDPKKQEEALNFLEFLKNRP